MITPSNVAPERSTASDASAIATWPPGPAQTRITTLPNSADDI